MKNLFGFALFPLLCMGIIILTALVIIFALRRGTKTINETAQQVIAEKQTKNSANTRWARGDLQAGAENKPPEQIQMACPACGAQNPAGSGNCAYCGHSLPK